MTVVGQRSDAVKRYIEESGFPFNILVDERRDVIKQYGVWHQVGLSAWNIARPALFLVDGDGTIRYLFVGETQDEFPSHAAIVTELERLNSIETRI